jgi:uncharacterized membrane protein (DUF485 family)
LDDESFPNAPVEAPGYAHQDPGFRSAYEQPVDSSGDDGFFTEAEFDSVEEVDGVARSVRRVAIRYGLVFLAFFMAVPVLSALAPMWFARPIWGGLTLNFLAVALLLHIVLIVLAVAYARFADHIEEEMLGRRSSGSPSGPDGEAEGV